MNEERQFPDNDQFDESLHVAVQALMTQQPENDELETSIERIKVHARQLKNYPSQSLSSPAPTLVRMQTNSRAARWAIGLLVGAIMLMAGATLAISPSASSLFAEVVAKADELKVVIYHRSDFAWAEEHAAMAKPGCKLYLQPEWEKSEKMNPLIRSFIENNPQWRLSLQTHKYLNIP
jgi:organic radical activating enzyme